LAYLANVGAKPTSVVDQVTTPATETTIPAEDTKPVTSELPTETQPATSELPTETKSAEPQQKQPDLPVNE